MDRSSFLTPPAKRTGFPGPNSANGSAKRVKPNQVAQPGPLSVPPGSVSFRLLCPVSHVGGVIGKSGNVIKQLQKSIGAKVRVEEAPPESPDRVITVIAQAALTSKIKLKIKNPSNEEEEEEIEISKAQEALIRVFELAVGSEMGSGSVSCRLLTEASHAGAVIGKGGKVVEKLRKETGCKISVVTEKLPLCAERDEEMVQIEGDFLAVKMALLSVSRCLQDVQPINTTRTAGNKALNTVTQETVLRPFDTVVQETPHRPVEVLSREPLLRSSNILSQDALPRPFHIVSQDALPRPSQVASLDAIRRPIEIVPHGAFRRPVELFPQDTLLRRTEMTPRESLPKQNVDYLVHRNSVLNTPPPSSTTYVSGLYSLPMESSTPETKTVNQNVVFKILCSSDRAGGIIGKGGAIIRALQSETGATINIGNTLPDCDERLITVTATESPEVRNSPAQKAVLLIFSRALEVAVEKGLDSGSNNSSSITARLVIPSNQVGCLLGKGGAIISEIRKATGTGIQILKVDQNPKSVSENEQVVQISGEWGNVKEAICHVTNRLRDNLFPNSVKGTGDKKSVSQITDRSPQGKMDDSVPIGFQPSFNHSQTLNVSTHGRSDDSLLSGFHPSSSVSYSQTLGRPSTLDHIGLSRSLDQPPSSQSWASKTGAPAVPRGFPDIDGGLAFARGGVILGSGRKSAIVTNTTVEIRVPEIVMGSVYGENGRNLEHLRKISGARVIVHEPHLGTSDRIIVISGTPDQTQAAQNLLHAYILTGETSR